MLLPGGAPEAGKRRVPCRHGRVLKPSGIVPRERIS